MDNIQKQAPSATKVLLFRSQGVDMLKEAMNAGVLMPEVNHQIDQVVAENEKLRDEVSQLRELALKQRACIINYRARRLASYEQRIIPEAHYTAAIIAAVSFLATSTVLAVALFMTAFA